MMWNVDRNPDPRITVDVSCHTWQDCVTVRQGPSNTHNIVCLPAFV